MKKISIKFFFPIIIIISILCTENYGQMPPHPSLLERIKNGEQAAPYAFSNISLIRSKGVDEAWSAPELKAQRLQKQKPFSRTFGPSAAPSGSWKALAILVQFSDKPSQVNATYFDNLLFGQTTGTLRDYYNKVSYGNLDIITINLPSVIGWTTAPQTYSYYVNGQNGTGSYPQNSQKLTEDVINLVNPFIDFSQYDNNGDSYVDALFVIHTGPGAEYTGMYDDIWSHAWTTSEPQFLDGVNIYNYSIEPEYWLNPGDMTCGVFAHEMGHAAFGLPDLYDIFYSSEGLGYWSLMAAGSWNGPSNLEGYPDGSFPALPDAWSHYQMGYITPTIVSTNIIGQSINNIGNMPEAYLLQTALSGSEYFLIENRQQTGYDSYLPGNGLCIYHIDDSVSGNYNVWYPPNIYSGHYHVALEQADGRWDLERKGDRGDDGDPYPGATNNLNFGASTAPDSKNYSLNETGIEVSNISPSSSIMTADLKVDVPVSAAQFTELTSISLTNVEGGSTEWGDYDSDGDLDILLTGYLDSDSESCPISKIFRNNGDNTFTDQTSISLIGVWMSSVAWGDYDNDGDLDILLTGRDYEYNSVSKIYRNNGNNTFEEQPISLTGIYKGSAAWGDYDNDGYLDILLACSNLTKIYRNNGNNTFIEQTSIYLKTGKAYWGDYDNDGYLDILLARTGSVDDEVPGSTIYHNNGDNSFTEITSFYPFLQSMNQGSAAWGDYDDDGDLDIVLTTLFNDGVHGFDFPETIIYRNNEGIFTKQVFIENFGGGSVAWGDYDNDGDLDVSLAGYFDEYINIPVFIICRNDGNDKFSIQQYFSLSGLKVGSAAWGDYDNDGDLDLIIDGKVYRNNNLIPNTPPAIPSNLTTITNGNDIAFSWDKSTDNETPQNGLHYNLVIGTTSNGVDKLSPMADRSTGYRRVVRLGNSQTNSFIIKGLPDGPYYWSVQAIDNCFAGSNFAPAQSFTSGGEVFEQFTELTSISLTGVNNGSTEWGDYDNDGDLDILLTGTTEDNNTIAKIYQNIGNNTFIEQILSFSVGGGADGSASWGDYDNDGYLDIYLSSLDSSKIYRNNGDNTFSDQSISLNIETASSSSWGDYNNDGDLDILLTGNFIAKIYRNNGDNTFSDQSISLNIEGASSSSWGDYDNDGDLDIILTGTGLPLVYPVSKIYKNNGDNTFTEQTSISLTGVNSGSTEWGDYDNDGDLDILLTGDTTTLYTSFPISKIYRNNGDNSFTDQTLINLRGLSGGQAVWGDYDNDGYLDILLTGNGYSKIYHNNGDNTFTDQVFSFINLTGLYNSSATWGDYDNDGDLDIFLTGRNEHFESITKIYRNNNLTPNTLPIAPYNLQALVNGNDVTFSWDKSNDNETPQDGLHYNLVIGTTPNGTHILSPMADRSTGYRRVVRLGNSQTNSWTIKNLPDGHYYWSVQAIDNSFAGSAFAPEQVVDKPLPVELTTFTAEVLKSAVKLVWKTASELNNYGFEVERKQKTEDRSQKTEWRKVGFVEGNGNSISPKNYEYVDKQALGGSKFIYRLKQIDTDGSYSYSEEVTAELIPKDFELFQNYPNPFNPSTVIRYALPLESDVKLTLYDVLGNRVKTLTEEKKPAGIHEFIFNASNLANGVYIYRLQAGSSVQIKKMLLLK